MGEVNRRDFLKMCSLAVVSPTVISSFESPVHEFGNYQIDDKSMPDWMAGGRAIANTWADMPPEPSTYPEWESWNMKMSIREASIDLVKQSRP